MLVSLGGIRVGEGSPGRRDSTDHQTFEHFIRDARSDGDGAQHRFLPKFGQAKGKGPRRR